MEESSCELVYVSEFDMNDPRYKVVFQYKEGCRATSQAFKEADALATINATYEKESVYTAMCVRGMGDPVKHVVNFPSNNATLIRDKERAVPTHISVVLSE